MRHRTNKRQWYLFVVRMNNNNARGAPHQPTSAHLAFACAALRPVRFL